MILSQAQAKAVYAAMCELNDIGARLNAEFDYRAGPQRIKVFDNGLGVFVQFVNWTIAEQYSSQNKFAVAYNLIPT
jgi:hypothetical protein